MILVRNQWFKKGKNCTISKARVLVEQFLVHPNWIICVRVTPASMVDLNFRPLNWLGWIKLLLTTWNCNLSPMIFSISFPKVLSKTIGLNDLGKSYDGLLGLGMITVNDILKWFGQYPKSMHALAILMTLVIQSPSFIMDLRCLYDSLSSPGVNELLQLPKAILNSSFENGVQIEVCLFPISSKMLVLTWRWSTVLKKEWRAFHKLSREKHGWLLYLIASTAGNLCLLTQFMSSQGPQLLLATSWILVSKKALLVVLTIFLNDFQSSRHLDSQYILRDRLQSLFHHILECFVILTLLALVFQACLILAANRLMTCSRDSQSTRFVVSSNLKTQVTSLMNSSSSLLFFDRENLEVITCSSSMGIVIVRGAWSEMSLQDGWIE